MYDLQAGVQNSNPKKLCSCSDHSPKGFTKNSSTAISSHAFWRSQTNVSWLSRAFIYLVKFYQASFSYFLGGNCRFYPSCSHYAVESFLTHSFLRAFKLTTIRLLKCHPFHPQKGYDPVPTYKG